MTAPHVRRVFTCLRCLNEWYPIVERPATCPKCRRQDWDKPAEVAPEPPPTPKPPCVHRLTFRSEHAAFLARQGARDAQALIEHQERRGERRYTADEVYVRPPVTEQGAPFVLAKLTLTRRKHRRKAE